ncbi:MAG: PEGA domain-containing protein [candidate division WOR-3 bacterium]
MRSRSGLLLAIVALVCLCADVAFAEKTCPQCGTVNRDDARFCKSCGAKLPEAERYVPPAPRVRVDVSVEGSSVTITSDPSGAKVTIAGIERGTTPLEIRGLAPGRYGLEVERSGYRSYSGSFTVSPPRATLIVTTEPAGAEIWLDGELKGRTTAAGLAIPRVDEGSHTLKAKLAGYGDATKAVEVSGSGSVTVLMRLEPARGFLSVTSIPSGAAVTANGQRLGVTSLIAGLSPQRYSLQVTKPGFQEWLGYADIVPAETAFVSATLEKMPTRKWYLLAAGSVLAAGAGGAALLAEQAYGKYREARTRAETERYRQETLLWDNIRNVAASAGGVTLGLYFILRW